jgi:Pentapeptide repeats (8 copies)
VDQKQLEMGKENLRWFLLITAVWVTVLVLILVGYPLQWTGFREKTLWDWMQLLLTATVTSIIAYLGQKISSQQYLGQQEAEENRAQAEALEAYLDQIGQLLLDDERPLRKTGEGDEERTIARAWTLAVLSRLSGARRGTVVQFLYEADLITRKTSRIIPGKDTINAPRESNIEDIQRWIIESTTGDIPRWITRGGIVDLRGADLSRSSLDATILGKAHLAGADLSGANLSGAQLSTYREGFLRVADLSDTNLSGANLSNVTLASSSYLPEFARNGMEEIPIGGEPTMEMKQEIQRRADSIAELTVEEKACLELEYLAKSLEGATMPNGQKYEDWLKSKGRAEDG